MDMSVQRKLALGNGILTTDTIAQAAERADPQQGDKGGDAARAAIGLALLKRRLGSMKKSDLRSAARLAASQALYQMEVAEKGLSDILAEFEAHWIGKEIEGDAYNPAELAFFRDVVSGVLRDQVPIDRGLDDTLTKGWPLRRVEALMRAILRAGYLRIAQPPGRACARRLDGICRRRRRVLRSRRMRHDQRRARCAGAANATGGVHCRPLIKEPSLASRCGR